MTNYTEAALAAIRYFKTCKEFIRVITKNSRYLILELSYGVFRVKKCGLMKWWLT